MSFAAAALVVAAAGAPAAAPAGSFSDSAQVTVTVLKPAAVRQGSGPVPQPDAPAYQLTRREGLVLVEYQ
jgi:hypothetical protein